MTCFFFILTMNLLGLIVIFPGGANLTGNISVTLVLAVLVFIVTNVTKSKHYWKEILPAGCPDVFEIPIADHAIYRDFRNFHKVKLRYVSVYLPI